MKTKLFFLFIVLLNSSNLFCQNQLYFKDFDYFKMQGLDTIKDMTIPPQFYVKCLYNQAGKLMTICPYSKRDGEHVYLSGYGSVLGIKGVNMVFSQSSKVKDQNYRNIYHKKSFRSDTAFVINDTLIFKATSINQIRIQIFTNIVSDSIFFKEMLFEVDKKKTSDISLLKSIFHYKEWFELDNSAYRILRGTIKLKQDPIMVWQVQKSSYYTNLINITKWDFRDMITMPVSLFWLKNSGLLY